MLASLTLQDLLLDFRAGDNAVAVLSFEGRQTNAMTFAQLRDVAMQIARTLANHGLAPGASIGLMGANSVEWIQSFFGIVAAGCVAVPIDVQAADDDLQRMLRISECRLVLAGSDLAVRLGAAGVKYAPLGWHSAEAGETNIALMARPEDIAMLVFTSGTTGTPKPVELSHGNLMSNVLALRSEKIVGPGDHVLIPLPLHHVYPLTVGMLTVLASGATIVLPSGLSGPQLLEAVQYGEVTALLGVPRLYTTLLANLRAAIARRKGLTARLFPSLLAISEFAQRRLRLRLGGMLFRRARGEIGSKLRLLVSGGAALKVGDEWALNALGWEVLTGYGLTETSPILTFNRPHHPRIGSAGQALPGVQLRIANPDLSGVGEIQATGASVFSRYRKDEAATSATFTADGWLRTGDLGYLDAESYLHVTGRAIETIILPSGKKIDPETLESLYVGDPVIKEIAILGGATGPTALVVPDEQVLRESGTLRLHDRIADALLARSRALPSHLRLSGFAITRTALPRTPLGKLRRHLLRPLYTHAVHQDWPASSQPATNETMPEGPGTAALWQWLRMRYPGKKLEANTSLQLDLGVDSLGWIDLSLALQRAFAITLTEQQTARIITVGDLLREAVTAQANMPLATTSADAEAWLAPYGPNLRILRAGGEMLLRLVMRVAFRLKVHGLEHLPAPPFVICPNHASYLDAFALAAALPHRQLMKSYFAGWTGLLFATPAERLFSRAAQIIPIDPDRAVAASIANAVAVLRHGNTLIWFPEGKISPDGNLQTFQPGIDAVLEQELVPVVPAWIDGTAAALPPGKRLPRPYAVTVKFGPAINVQTVTAEIAGRAGQNSVAASLHAAVAGLALHGAEEDISVKGDQ